MKGKDEPQLVSHRVLEGVTEPYEKENNVKIPEWKTMKDSADHKVAMQLIQQALKEYGQILRHPNIFGEMPMLERYDVFLSMAKLLKLMGFYQRAELLLYEAMSYNQEPYEAHLQLGLLFLDREDLERAKVHLKNCLFYRQSDIFILIHLVVVLVAEGRVHEAKFYVTRVLTNLEERVARLSFLMGNPSQSSGSGGTHSDQAMPSPGEEGREGVLSDDKKAWVMNAAGTHPKDTQIGHAQFLQWVEDLTVKVFHGEFKLFPSATVDLFRMFSRLFDWLADGEMSGRFVFDLGQSLYEGGRPQVGAMMMRRGLSTADPRIEGAVSFEVIRLRLALDFPVVPDSALEVISAYLNLTHFLTSTSQSFQRIDIENVLDVSWPLPLWAWSSLPVSPVMKEVMYRFENGPVRTDAHAQHWLRAHLDIVDSFHNHSSQQQQPNSGQSDRPKKSGSNLNLESLLWGNKRDPVANTKPKPAPDSSPVSEPLEIGILGGHMNGHPVGRTVIRLTNHFSDRKRFRITLLALPLKPDETTSKIASVMSKIVNLPADPIQAWSLLEQLKLDVLLYPDWQPFPDSMSILLQNRRLAPVQACFYVRGGGCIGSDSDYYLLPSDISSSYTHSWLEGGKLKTRSSHIAGSSGLGRPLWLQQETNAQIVTLNWQLFTPQVVKSLGAEAEAETAPLTHLSHGYDALSGQPRVDYLNELEGPIFFEDQAVAILPLHHSQLHPLMDDAIFQIMHMSTRLQILIVLPEIFLNDLPVARRMAWSRRLLRRLCQRGGTLSQRIRLLPSPVSDHRLLQLLRQSDVALDSFPLGSGPHTLGLALSVGTPVITMDSGITLATPKDDLSEIRSFLNHTSNRHFQDNAMYQYLKHHDVPWEPTRSPLSGFYKRIGLAEDLVANSTLDYVRLAHKLIEDREALYSLRVKLLAAIDGDAAPVSATRDRHMSKSRTDVESIKDVEDVSEFVLRIGRPWAASRTGLVRQSLQSGKNPSVSSRRYSDDRHHHFASASGGNLELSKAPEFEFGEESSDWVGERAVHVEDPIEALDESIRFRLITM